MTKYSHEENATVAFMIFKMKMQQITENLQNSSSKAFVEVK